MLSDVCYEFIQAITEEAKELAKQVHWYSSPDSPVPYGEEIDALRRACVAVDERPHDVEAIVALVRLAESIRRFHDTPPDAAEAEVRKGEMLALVEILRKENIGDAAAKSLVANIGRDDVSGKEAAVEVQSILRRLSKPAYEAATKIIADIGSATAKHILGL